MLRFYPPFAKTSFFQQRKRNLVIEVSLFTENRKNIFYYFGSFLIISYIIIVFIYVMGNKKIKTYSKMPKDAKSIPGYPTYYARPNGEIWRDAPAKITGFGTVKPKIFKLSTTANQQGYVMVQPYIDKKKYVRYVHRLVAEAFLGCCPEGYQVDHIDNDNTNNHYTNLQYLTPKDNILKKPIKSFSYGNGRKQHKEYQGKWYSFKSKIIQLRKEGKKVREIALELGIPEKVIYYIK
jgi:hypothetical protein